jgi:CelD/BcsL family acetyltransferase involved in cellulose biosynthesis
MAGTVAQASASSRRCSIAHAEPRAVTHSHESGTHRTGESAATAGATALRFEAWSQESARALLHAGAFKEEWRALARACPWATVFQEPAFSEAWWAVYADAFEPLLLTARDRDGTLQGLLALARDRASRRVVPVGAHHAEYHAWVAASNVGDAVMRDALRPLREALRVRRLRFHFLAPGAPTGWLAHARGPFAPLALRSDHPRGLRTLGDGGLDRQALRKKAARSKLARLEREGPVEYRAITEPAEFEHWLPQIIAQTDARHGSGSVAGPFAADPRKADFYRRLVREPGLMHCGVLVRGDQLLASHTGWIDRGALGLGLITFDAREAAHSPGSLLLHLVGEDVARRGMATTFDLTPGGAYKERFATHGDTVHTVDLHLHPASAFPAVVHRVARRAARRILGRA